MNLKTQIADLILYFILKIEALTFSVCGFFFNLLKFNKRSMAPPGIEPGTLGLEV